MSGSDHTTMYRTGAGTRALALAGALAGLAVPTEGAMGLGKTLYLFCEVSGTVLAGDGRPVAGAEVERSWFWGFRERRGTETVVTDAQGRFRFAEIAESSLLGALVPHQALVTQKIVIRHDGRDYEAWVSTRYDYERNSELDGQAAELVCALDAPAQAHGSVYGICRARHP